MKIEILANQAENRLKNENVRFSINWLVFKDQTQYSYIIDLIGRKYHIVIRLVAVIYQKAIRQSR